jgi:hypothetical protein
MDVNVDDFFQGGINWIILNGTSSTAEVVVRHGGKSLRNFEFAVAAEKSGLSAGMSKPFLTCLYEVDGGKSNHVPGIAFCNAYRGLTPLTGSRGGGVQ